VFPWLRLLWIGLSLIGKPRIDLLATTRIRLRVWPNDLDANLHVNNGRYLALADIGRMHWFARAGLMGLARQQKAFPVVGDAIAKFRRELTVFQSFEIHTRLIGWDRKWGFIEHRFVRNGRVLAVVAIRGVFKGPNGPVDPNVFLAALSHSMPSPELPQWATGFHEGCESLTSLLRTEEAGPASGN
jgi:acyl-CoA thioesterase FadM